MCSRHDSAVENRRWHTVHQYEGPERAVAAANDGPEAIDVTTFVTAAWGATWLAAIEAMIWGCWWG
jgi:hypothetical protein